MNSSVTWSAVMFRSSVERLSANRLISLAVPISRVSP
jgi:hypothetical protein